MKTSIYIPDNEWAGIKDRIGALGISLSTYLVMLHNDGLKSLAGEIADLIHKKEATTQHIPLVPIFKPKPFEPAPVSVTLPKAQGWSIQPDVEGETVQRV